MPSSTTRQVTQRRRVGFVEVVFYDTGLIHFNWPSRDKILLSLPQAQDVSEETILNLAELINEEETSVVQSYYEHGITVKYPPAAGRLEGLNHVMEAKLEPAAKLIYVIALLHTATPLSNEILDEVFEKQPDPFGKLKPLILPLPRHATALIQSAFYTNFKAPQGGKQKTEEEFKRFSLLTGFLTSPKAITYGAFLEEHSGETFIQRNTLTDFHPSAFRIVSREIVKDLYPVEYERFMRYFGSLVPSELRQWSLERFKSGVKPIAETGTAGVESLHKTETSWLSTINVLTVEEALRFVEFANQDKGIKTIFSGADSHSGPLLAFYFLEGRLSELIAHIAQNDRAVGWRTGYKPLINQTWKNPFVEEERRTVRLLPYVRALRDPIFKDVPLEWALATL